ncbi:MAG: BatA domain-containing protein [Candidatus Glassbacteria bacterium]|nr:BatA domain-containing protein [Candidatus Glassbacteria bacterium]
MINFLNPLFLFALAAAAIPFIIHFLNRFRARRQEFSSLMLLKEIQHHQMRRLKMRQWLLLILRTLIIALLVLAPARPVVRGIFRSGPADHLPTAAVFILDTSASLGYVGREGPAFEYLLGRLRLIAGWLNPSDRYRMIAADESYRLLDSQWSHPAADNTSTPGLSFPERPGNRATSLGPALAAARDLLTAETGFAGREVYLFTDRQQGFLGVDSLELDPSSGIRWYLVEPHQGEPENLAIVSVAMPGELVRPGVPLKAAVEVAHHGGSESLQCLPRVYLDGRLVAQGEAVVPPDRVVPVVVELPAMEAGFHELTAVLDADNLAADNRRSVVVNVPSRARVMLVENRQATEDYLGTALEVMAEEGAGPLVLSRRRSLPLSDSELGRADQVILHGLDFPAAAMQAFWERAATRGASVLVFPSAADRDEAAVLRNFNAALARAGLPLSLGPAVSSGRGSYDTPGAGRGAAASAGSVFDPLFGAIPGWERIKVFVRRSLPSAGGTPAADGTGGAAAPLAWDMPLAGGGILLRLVRTPVLKAAVATADLSDPAECELPETPLFVPLLHALITLVAAEGPLIGSHYRVGETVNIFFGVEVSTEHMVIHGPDDNRYRLPPGKLARFDFSQTELPGTYRLYEAEKLVGAFSVGLAPQESDIRLEDREKLKSLFGGAGLEIIGPGQDLAQTVFLERGGVEVWPALIVLVILLLVAEQLVASHKRTED